MKGPLPAPQVPFERERGLDEAERIARADIASLGWRPRLTGLAAGEPTAYLCSLHDQDDLPVPNGRGAGKCGTRSASVGALFEALEHALSGRTALDGLAITTVPVGRLDPAVLDDPVLTPLQHQRERAVACLRYRELQGGETLDIPIIMWAYWYGDSELDDARGELGDTVDYRLLRTCSYTTGCAIGTSEDEALLHAVHECVERDAFSLFLLHSVYRGGPLPTAVPTAALPGSARRFVVRCGELAGAEPLVLDLTTDLGVPVYLAYAPPDPNGVPRYGLGASSSAHVAVERALGELAQETLGRQDGAAAHRHHREILHHLRGQPRLLACAGLDLEARTGELRYRAGLPPQPRRTTVRRQLHESVSRIRARGHRVLAHRLRALPNGSTLVQAQCLGLERFHLIMDGHLALPGPRGRSGPPVPVATCAAVAGRTNPG